MRRPTLAAVALVLAACGAGTSDDPVEQLPSPSSSAATDSTSTVATTARSSSPAADGVAVLEIEHLTLLELADGGER